MNEFKSLTLALDAALKRARGKGQARHGAEGRPFEDQAGPTVRRMVGPGFTTGQIIKKLLECQEGALSLEAKRDEMLDVMVYAAIEIIVTSSERGVELQDWLEGV